jgi:endonuclease/exonuclease/phosphatase (EEP) superfamily protein YafD
VCGGAGVSGTARNRHRKRGEHSRATVACQFLLPLLPLVLLVLLRNGLGERWYLTALLVYAPPLPLGLVAAAAVLPGLRRRPPAVAALNVTLAVAFVLTTSGVTLPRLRPAIDGTCLRLVTFNVYRGGSGVAPLAPLVQRERPDVLCLQEVGPGPGDRRRGWRDLVRELPVGWRLVHRGELTLATRLPLTDAAWFPLSRRFPTSRHHDRDALRATVWVADRPIQVVTAHLSVPTAPWILREADCGLRHWHFLRNLREDQTTRLLAALASLPGPVLLAGDMNSTPLCETHARLATALADTFETRGCGWGYTFPALRPLLRVDYVFADRRLQVAGCHVLAAAGSDHRPVLADLRLPTQPSATVLPEHRKPERPPDSRGTAEWRPITQIEEIRGEDRKS